MRYFIFKMQSTRNEFIQVSKAKKSINIGFQCNQHSLVHQFPIISFSEFGGQGVAFDVILDISFPFSAGIPFRSI